MKSKLNSNTHILYVIAHGFAARMLFQTGLIEQLTQAGKSVAIIAPDANDPTIAELSKNPKIEVFEASADTNIWGDDYLFKRKYFFENIEANPALWEKHIQSVFYNTSLHPWRRVRPFYYFLIYKLIRFFPSIRRRFEEREHRHLQSKTVKDLIEKINPQMVISTYPVNLLEAQVLFAAKEKNISTTIHLLSWDNITSKGKFPVTADNFIVWGDIMREELEEYYQMSPKQIQTVGVPHFDHHIKVKNNPGVHELLTDLELKPDQPYIFMAMSSPYFAPKEIDIAEWLSAKIEENIFGENMQLIIRPHPQNVSGFMADKSWLGRLKNLKSDRVAVDFPKLVKSKLRWSMAKNDMSHLSNLLIGCSVCLNSGSTVSIDALVVEKPVILTSFDADAKLSYWKSARRLIDYTHLKKFIESGGAVPVFSFEELAKKINDYIADPSLDFEKRSNALRRQCFKNDGKSTERAVEAVTKLLK